MNKIISRSEFIKNISKASVGLGLSTNIMSPIVSNGRNRGKVDNTFEIRGFLLDLRVEEMTMQALKETAAQLSKLGVNALIIEYTATFPYRKHATITGENAYTREEIEDLVSYCEALGMDIIPLQENLGHVQYILSHERYANLRIHREIISQVDLLNRDTIPLFKDLIEDVISLHPSKYIHLGGDETRHLLDERFKDYVQQHGVSKLYTQYMKQICEIAIKKGKTPLLWADMILRYPDAIEDLPVDKIIFINWIYTGAKADMFGDVKALQEKGCTFWGAPALRSWPDNYFIVRWNYHLENIRKFIPYSRRAGYKGMIMTSWSTSGIYDCRWEGPTKILLEKFPRRNLYPLSGFNLLIAAYHLALHSEKEMNIRRFVMDYGKKKFGLSDKQSVDFWNYISYNQELIKTGKYFNFEHINNTLESFKKICRPLQKIIPLHHEKEFKHIQLMADLRIFYLSVLRIESMVESEHFDRSMVKQVKGKLEPLVQTANKLNYRFIALNEGYLFNTELERLNNLRNVRLQKLWSVYGN